MSDVLSALHVPDDIILCYFFFFQAEDGIRDLTVTGVQTCALPISNPSALSRASPGRVTVSSSRERMVPHMARKSHHGNFGKGVPFRSDGTSRRGIHLLRRALHRRLRRRQARDGDAVGRAAHVIEPGL